MPLRLGDTITEDAFATGQDGDNIFVPLLAGQVVTITSADPATVVIAQDPTARVTTKDVLAPDGKTVLVPAGTVTQASAKVSAAKPPKAINTPINVTVHVANADGTPVLDDTGTPVADLVDTVTIVPGLLKSEGILFIA